MTSPFQAAMDNHYLAVGMVTVEATKLDAMCAYMAELSRIAPTNVRSADYMRLTKTATGARDALKAQVATHPEDDELRRFYDEATAVLDERNRWVHDVVTVGEEGMLGLYNAKTETSRRAPELAEAEALKIRLQAIQGRALALARTIHLARLAEAEA